MTIQKPFKGDYRISQTFGEMHDYRGTQKAHKGLDWALPKGTPVLASADGRVTKSTRIYTPFGFGKEIIIVHKGFSTQYAHLNDVLVKVGQNILVGDTIGYSGNTGYVLGKNGYHLHFGLNNGIKYIDPLPHILSSEYISEIDQKISNIVPIANELKKTLEIIYLYEIKPGDTLSKIADTFYKDHEFWKIIFKANHSEIEDPNLIYPGQKIILPYIR